MELKITYIHFLVALAFNSAWYSKAYRLSPTSPEDQDLSIRWPSTADYFVISWSGPQSTADLLCNQMIRVPQSTADLLCHQLIRSPINSCLLWHQLKRSPMINWLLCHQLFRSPMNSWFTLPSADQVTNEQLIYIAINCSGPLSRADPLCQQMIHFAVSWPGFRSSADSVAISCLAMLNQMMGSWLHSNLQQA